MISITSTHVRLRYHALTQPYTTLIGECTRLPYTSKREVQEEGGGKARVFPSSHRQEDDQRADIYYTNDSILYSLLCL
jgi:hypothetical protein